MTGRQWFTTIADLGNSVWENAALPKSYWNKDEGYNQSNIHIPPTFAGVGDGVVEEISNYPQLVKLGYDVATKKDVREGLWNSVKNITPESIKNAAINFYEEKKNNYTSDKSYIVNHTVGKDAVAIASLFMGGGATKGLKEATNNIDDGIKKVGEKVKSAIKKKLDDVDEFMKTPEFQKIVDDAWKRYKKNMPKEQWEQMYKNLYRNKEKGTITEKTFDDLMGFDSHQLEIQVGNSKRIIDNVKNGVAREVKSGKVTWSKYKDQVLKDIRIIKERLDENIHKIEWHCFDEVDDTFIKNVKDELKKAGIKESDFIIIKY